MAAYAALLSLTHIIHDLQNHPSPPISIDPQQLQSLSQILTFLLEFLENSESPVADGDDEADPFEMRIADAAYAAEDVVESPLVNVLQLAAKLTRFFNYIRASKGIKFYQDLQQVIEEMDLIKQMAVERKTERAMAVHTHNASLSAVPLRSASSSSTAMVCSDSVLYGLVVKLVGGGQDSHVIPIVGMGGIGDRSEDELGTELYQYLFGRRFLIVMDDMWSIDVWEKIQLYFPNNKNGSRIMVTTRLSQLSSQLNPNDSLQMKFLDEASSWELFSNTVFGERICPDELKNIGEKIVENCRGLPLSIIVVGGLLKKMARTRGCWESIRDNLTSIVKLKTLYRKLKGWFSFHDEDYCVSNFQFLSKLVNLNISCNWISGDAPNLHKLTFPNSLKRLSLAMNNEFEWEEIIEKIGSLPHLQKLKLSGGCFGSGKWEMVEGQFQELRYLRLDKTRGLKQWIVEDSSVLPRLEWLSLYDIKELEEFPCEIGNITTLKQVEICWCNEALARSAREMVDEQVEVQGDLLPFHVHVKLLFDHNEALQRLSTPNFTLVVL